MRQDTLNDRVRQLIYEYSSERLTTRELVRLARDAGLHEVYDIDTLIDTQLTKIIKAVTHKTRENMNDPSGWLFTVTAEDQQGAHRDVWVSATDASQREADEVLRRYHRGGEQMFAKERVLKRFFEEVQGYQLTFSDLESEAT